MTKKNVFYPPIRGLKSNIYMFIISFGLLLIAFAFLSGSIYAGIGFGFIFAIPSTLILNWIFAGGNIEK